jgi:hypothetical protein
LHRLLRRGQLATGGNRRPRRQQSDIQSPKTTKDRNPHFSQLRLSAFVEFFTFDNTERSLFAFLLVFLVLGNHLIPALTPLNRVCLELVSAVKQRHRALAEKRYTREQGLYHG